MAERGDLGIGYLVGTGLGLAASAFGYLLLVDVVLPVHWLGVVVTAGFGATLASVGVWLRRGDLSGSHAWQVALWCALGLSVPTFAGVLITVVRLQPSIESLFKSLFIVSVATGGVVGMLIGAVVQLNEEHSTARSLAQRASVLNRVLRHNVRNDMNLILAHADSLREDDGSAEEIADRIHHTGMRIVDMSRAVRHVEKLGTEPERPVDVVPVVEDRVSSARAAFPGARVTADLPATARANADTMLQVVLDNLIANAIQHNDGPEPEVRVSVRRDSPSGEWVTIRVTDDGPGIPERELDALARESETALKHGSGIGLWLVKWFVESYGGELEFRENQPRGTVVTVRLPAAPPGADPPPGPPGGPVPDDRLRE